MQAEKTLQLEFPTEMSISHFDSWEHDVTMLESYFSGIELPDFPIRLNQLSTILNPALFVDTHLGFVKANPRSERFRPYLDRLILFKKLLNEKFKI